MTPLVMRFLDTIAAHKMREPVTEIAGEGWTRYILTRPRREAIARRARRVAVSRWRLRAGRSRRARRFRA